MDEFEAGPQPVPVLLRPEQRAERPSERSSLWRHAPHADFLSQLIAERQHLPPQRARRRAAVGVAVSAYDEGGKRAVRRLPPGYRRSIVT